MSEHYFSKKPQSISSPKTWNYQLKEKRYTFTSDAGVFSKNEVDFGSKLLIEAFQAPSIPGDLLDLGCGYGPIGIVLADCNKERTTTLADINARAIGLARQNAEANHVNNVEFVESDRFKNLAGRKFAAVISNPPIRAGKQIVHAIFTEAEQALCAHGELWIVIQKKQGAPSAKQKLEELFGNAEIVSKSKGYCIIKSIK